MADPDKPPVTGEQRDDFRERASRLAEQMGLEIPVRRDREPTTPDMNALIRAGARRRPSPPRTTEGDK